MLDFLLLTPLRRYSGAGILLMRTVVGVFLLFGIWDVLTSEARLHAYAAYLGRFHFPLPYLMGRLSVYAQAFIGVGFIAGLCVRWAGIFCAAHFAVTLGMIERFAGMQNAFPAACLMAIGVFFALHGAGRFGLDTFLEVDANQRFDRHY